MIPKNILQKMYHQGFSMMDISKKLRVNVNTVIYWMKKYQLNRRSVGDALYRKYNFHGEPFRFKNVLNNREKFLFGLGLGLFWGEGMKLDRYAVRLGNTDPFVILRFRDFLEKICGVRREKLKYYLQIFGDVDSEKAVQFWCNILSISPQKFGKISIVKLQRRGSYKHKNKFGVLQIACYNRNLKAIIDQMIGNLKTCFYAGVAQLAEHTHGGSQRSLPAYWETDMCIPNNGQKLS